MFHKHKWTKIKETYCPPTTPPMVSAIAEEWARYAFGFITILWECSVCKKLRKEEMLGKEKK